MCPPLPAPVPPPATSTRATQSGSPYDGAPPPCALGDADKPRKKGPAPGLHARSVMPDEEEREPPYAVNPPKILTPTPTSEPPPNKTYRIPKLTDEQIKDKKNKEAEEERARAAEEERRRDEREGWRTGARRKRPNLSAPHPPGKPGSTSAAVPPPSPHY